ALALEGAVARAAVAAHAPEQAHDVALEIDLAHHAAVGQLDLGGAGRAREEEGGGEDDAGSCEAGGGHAARSSSSRRVPRGRREQGRGRGQVAAQRRAGGTIVNEGLKAK